MSSVADASTATVPVTTPVDSTVVTGTVAVLASATDDIGVAGVQFTIDGQPAGPELDAAPYQLVWNTWDLANGTHTISARARDAAGHVAETSVSIVVTNDHVPPTVAIELIPGVTVSGVLPIVATASDDIGVAGVQLLLDDSPMSGELAGAPYELVWDTAQVANGNHVITAIARDAAGHQTTTSVAVTVDNSGIGNDLLTQ